MGHGISEDDRKRIRNFANRPGYDRGPESLLPEEDESEDESGEEAPGRD